MSEQQGGATWEAGEAWKLIVAAKLARDLNAEQLGWIRLMEAFTNASGSASAAQLIPMLKGLQIVQDERKSDAASVEHVTGMLLDQAEIEQAEMGQHAARLSLIDVAIAAALVAATDLSERVAALEAARHEHPKQ